MRLAVRAIVAGVGSLPEELSRIGRDVGREFGREGSSGGGDLSSGTRRLKQKGKDLFAGRGQAAAGRSRVSEASAPAGLPGLMQAGKSAAKQTNN
jgi:hypothetical protein